MDVKCSACEARLAAYLEGSAPPEQARAIEQHLSSCAGCRLLVSDMRALETRLTQVRPLEPRADFTAGVMAAIAALPKPAPARLRAGWLAGYLAGAWALILALNAFHVLNWQRLFAQGATEFGKAGAALATLVNVASRLHVPAFAAGALTLEMVVLIVGAVALRRLLPRLAGWFAGAQTI